MNTTTPPVPAPPVGPVAFAARHRAALVVGGSVLVAMIVVAWIGVAQGDSGAPLDPGGTGPDGARAVANVLRDQGVEVDVVRSADALDDAFGGRDVGDDTLVVVSSTEQLGESTIDRLLTVAPSGRLLLLDPTLRLLDALDALDAGDRSPISIPDGGLEAGCDDDLYSGLRLEVDAADAMPGSRPCFDGALNEVDVDGTTVALLGAGQALTNDQVLRADNAAVALRLLGQHPRVVWYVPTRDDLTSGDAVSVRDLLPLWLLPALWLVGVAGVTLVLWRGRRLGPLSVEPLPVTVRAIETTLSRGRLYRRAGDRAHAAAVLRQAARRRAARSLRLGRRPEEGAVIAAVAARIGAHERDVAPLLASTAPPPTTDHALIDLATALAALDDKVRHS